MTRAEHLAWAKQRALEYVDAGDLSQAVASMLSDIRKHPETTDHLGAALGIWMHINGLLTTPSATRHWIEGFQ